MVFQVPEVPLCAPSSNKVAYIVLDTSGKCPCCRFLLDASDNLVGYAKFSGCVHTHTCASILITAHSTHMY